MKWLRRILLALSLFIMLALISIAVLQVVIDDVVTYESLTSVEAYGNKIYTDWCLILAFAFVFCMMVWYFIKYICHK